MIGGLEIHLRQITVTLSRFNHHETSVILGGFSHAKPFVILSEIAGARSAAATESKDPYNAELPRVPRQTKRIPSSADAAIKVQGVLRLR